MTTAVPLLEMNNVSKVFGKVTVLDDVTVTLRPGEVRAIVGHNGAGKSTLMKILAGVHQPTSGSIRVRGRAATIAGPAAAHELGIRMVFQEFSLVPSLSVLANVVLAREPTRYGLLSARRARRTTRSAFSRLGVDIDPNRTVESLPVGDRQLVEIAKAISQDPAVLVLDEPTASLSTTEVSRLFEIVRRLAQSGIGILYISHHLDEITQLCDTVSVLRDGHLVADKAVAGLTVANLAALMLGNTSIAGLLKGRDRQDRSSSAVMTVENLRCPPRVSDMSFEVGSGEVVGIAGLLGSGRTETLEAIFGLRRRAGGRIRIRGRSVNPRSAAAAIKAGIMLVPEDRRTMGILGEQSVCDNILLSVWGRLTWLGFIRARQAGRLAESVSASMRIRASSLRVPMSTLSGGNQQKAIIGRALAVEPTVLMLDEPTAGIDINARQDILAVVRSYVSSDRGAILVSSDLQELATICDRILFVGRGRIVGMVKNDPAAPVDEVELTRLMHESVAS